MLTPIYIRYQNEIAFMSLDELRSELKRLENPTTTNIITLAVLENKAEIVREKIAKIEEKEN